ncbi:hypothetical protein FIBSPDRAFT_1039785 [Athelia psychrophila]|uniref:Uncharacterized protein n=1 Tax=Athelia psychrophila TaxID=1759441 RepID=A0A166RBI0_9AGAM|nr:hypothetical protein FIBSPDRAFT_1039785 [Fibularhizoctonia sp. CBS 109695]
MYSLKSRYSDAAIGFLPSFFRTGLPQPLPLPPPIWLMPESPPLVWTPTFEQLESNTPIVATLTRKIVAGSSPYTIGPIIFAAALMAAVTLASAYMLLSRARPKPKPHKNYCKPSLSASNSRSIWGRLLSPIAFIMHTVLLPASPIIIVAMLFTIHHHLLQVDDVEHLMFRALCTPLLGTARWHKSALLSLVARIPCAAVVDLRGICERMTSLWATLELFLNRLATNGATQSPSLTASLPYSLRTFLLSLAACSSLGAGSLLIYAHASPLQQVLRADFHIQRWHLSAQFAAEAAAEELRRKRAAESEEQSRDTRELIVILDGHIASIRATRALGRARGLEDDSPSIAQTRGRTPPNSRSHAPVRIHSTPRKALAGRRTSTSAQV